MGCTRLSRLTVTEYAYKALMGPATALSMDDPFRHR
jgi:hypothetical protein